jgi:AcrR family transcriptional regulator
MSRWEPDARGRLERASMELYLERGFEQTTVAEIAERAGLTKRTFFRHYVDKRDVLFAGAAHLEKLVVDAVTDAPDTATPIAAVIAGIEAAATLIEDLGEGPHARQRVIAANPELQERELVKLASLAAAIAGILGRRGVEPRAATLAAEAGVTVFKTAFEDWIREPGHQDLQALVHTALGDLKALLSDA